MTLPGMDDANAMLVSERQCRYWIVYSSARVIKTRRILSIERARLDTFSPQISRRNWVCCQRCQIRMFCSKGLPRCRIDCRKYRLVMSDGTIPRQTRLANLISLLSGRDSGNPTRLDCSDHIVRYWETNRPTSAPKLSIL